MFDSLYELISNYTYQTVALGSLLLGLISGVIGSFTYLQRQGLLGDGISHSTLPGIAIVFMLWQSKNNALLLIGAAIAGLLAMMFVLNIVKYTRVKFDASLALVLSVFFGLGMVCMTYVQNMPNASQAGLTSFILGQAATMLRSDLYFMLICALIVLSLAMLYWKEFQLFIFDRDFAQSSGYSTSLINGILACMIVMGIIVGLQTVGAILMCAMLISPAAAARQWTDKFPSMVILSALFASISGLIGTSISSLVTQMPTGPSIVIIINSLVIVSMLIAPRRGLIAKVCQRRQNRINFNKKSLENVLGN